MAQGREEDSRTARDRQQQGEEDERPEVVDNTARPWTGVRRLPEAVEGILDRRDQ